MLFYFCSFYNSGIGEHQECVKWNRKKENNDPSAGSPTETLLRLLLPLNKQIQIHLVFSEEIPLKPSSFYSIGRSDGRCVQRAGTYSTFDSDKILQGIPRSYKIIPIYNPCYSQTFEINQIY